MSQTRVVTGVDDRGRPKSEWRPTPGVDAEPRYGFMEPAHSAPIVRRQATPEELEAARAREDEPSHLVAPTIAKPPTAVVSTISQESRLRGGAVTAELYRNPAPIAEEERAVSEAPADIPRITPDDQLDRLRELEEATRAAGDAWIAKQAAEVSAAAAREAWDAAHELLTKKAFAAVDGVVLDAVPVPLYAVGGPVEPKPAPRTRTGEGQRPGQASARDRRATLVMDAMSRHGDDQGAVATELGMKKNAVAMVVKFARRREVQA